MKFWRRIKMSPKQKIATTLVEASIFTLEQRFNISKCKQGHEIDSKISLRPTLQWFDKKGSIIVCQVRDANPYDPIIDIAYSQIISSGLPIKMFVSYLESENLSGNQVKEYYRDVRALKAKGIGVIKINDNYEGEIIHKAISLPLFITQAEIDLQRFVPKLQTKVQDTYDIYMDGTDPSKAIQEIGQLIEGSLKHLAKLAIRNRKLIHTDYNPNNGRSIRNPRNYYALSTLIDDLITDSIIHRGTLGKCRGYCDERNDASHPVKNLKQLMAKEKKIKTNFLTGLSILEELPIKMKEKGYSYNF